MKKFVLICLVILTALLNYTFAVTIFQENLKSPIAILGTDHFYNKIAVLGVNSEDMKEYPVINIIENGNIKLLPAYIIKDNKEEKIIINSINSRIKFDNEGNLWLTGKSLYKFENNEWKEFYLDDEFNYVRNYCHIAVDGKNNLWITTSIFDKNNHSVNFAELLMFDGNSFETLLKRYPSFLYSTANSNISNEKVVKLNDGRIAFHKSLSRQNDKIIDSLDSNFDLVIYEPGNKGFEAYEIKTYDWNSSYNKIVNNIFPDNNKLWFAHNGNAVPLIENDKIVGVIKLHRGISIFDIETKEWYVFDKKNGIPWDDNEDMPMPVNYLTRLNDNKMIVNIKHQLYSIDNNYQMEQLDWDLILSDAVIYKSHEKVTDEEIFETIEELKKEKFEKTWLTNKVNKMYVTPDRYFYIQTSNFLIKSPVNILGAINNEIQDFGFNVYPNPANEILYISSTGTDITNIEITNILGLPVINLSGYSKQINIASLPNGIYFIKIHFTNGTSKSNKFIKCN